MSVMVGLNMCDWTSCPMGLMLDAIQPRGPGAKPPGEAGVFGEPQAPQFASVKLRTKKWAKQSYKLRKKKNRAGTKFVRFYVCQCRDSTYACSNITNI